MFYLESSFLLECMQPIYGHTIHNIRYKYFICRNKSVSGEKATANIACDETFKIQMHDEILYWHSRSVHHIKPK